MENVQSKVGHVFENPELLERAVTHPSFAAEQSPPVAHNQRLEFLGDAVLQLILTDLLFQRFPELDEGSLTKARSALANESSLADWAAELGLGEAIRLGKGEERAGGSKRPSNLADMFEAVLAGVYLDGGLTPALALCERLVNERIDDLETLLATENPKGTLQELTQQRYQTTPVYDVVDVSGPEHRPRFEVTVTVNETLLAKAAAGNRKEAEKRAAECALKELLTNDEQA